MFLSFCVAVTKCLRINNVKTGLISSHNYRVYSIMALKARGSWSHCICSQIRDSIAVIYELRKHLLVAVDVASIYNICSIWSQEFLPPEERYFRSIGPYVWSSVIFSNVTLKVGMF